MRIKCLKLYVYVDESGQDTEGRMFLVSVVIVGREREELREVLRAIESESGKKNHKWTRERRVRREAYIRSVLESKGMAGHIYYSHYEDAKTFVDLSILSTAKAILDKAKHPYQAQVYVDGLRKSERARFTAGLRKLHVSTSLVRGMRDEADEFIRLADAVAGFVRDGIEGDDIMEPLYKKAVKKGIIKET